MADKQRWLPLESNPDVMNGYIWSLGVPNDWTFNDVWGLDPEALQSVQRPVSAVLLLFPDKHDEESEATPLGEEDSEAGVYFMKQTIGNACGTIGLFHAILNNLEQIDMPSAAMMRKFYDETKDMNPEERAAHMENCDSINVAHEASAQEGQTSAPSRDEHVKHHFVTFVHHDGALYELDGRKGAPLKHGSTTPDSLLEDTAEVVKKFMARDPEQITFNVVALSKV